MKGHCQENRLRNYAFRRGPKSDNDRTKAHLDECYVEDSKTGQRRLGKCHAVLARIEDQLFALDADVSRVADEMELRFDANDDGFIPASDVARLMRLAHDRRVAAGICYAEPVLRAATDNATPTNQKVRAHARACPFCRVYLSGSGLSLIIGAPSSLKGKPVKKGGEERVRSPFEVETGVPDGTPEEAPDSDSAEGVAEEPVTVSVSAEGGETAAGEGVEPNSAGEDEVG